MDNENSIQASSDSGNTRFDPGFWIRAIAAGQMVGGGVGAAIGIYLAVSSDQSYETIWLLLGLGSAVAYQGFLLWRGYLGSVLVSSIMQLIQVVQYTGPNLMFEFHWGASVKLVFPAGDWLIRTQVGASALVSQASNVVEPFLAINVTSLAACLYLAWVYYSNVRRLRKMKQENRVHEADA